MGLSTTTVLKLLAKVDSTVEVQATVIVDIDVQRLEVGRSVDNTDLASLDKVVGDNEVLLVRSDLDVVRAHSGLVVVGVIQTLDVAQVADIEGGNVVGGGESQVEEAAILADVGAGERGEGQFRFNLCLT